MPALTVLDGLGNPVVLFAPRAHVSLSGEITVGGTAQDLIAEDSAYDYVELNNPSTNVESLFFNDTGVPCTNDPNLDTELPPGATYIWSAVGTVPVPTAAISINAATTGLNYRAKRV